MAENYNIKLILDYDGSNYSGWQRLKETNQKDSIQLVVEKVISEYFNEDIKIIGSGRTDAGVHALGQVANFYCKEKPDLIVLRKELNNKLPEDICILHLEEVNKEFHSRYSAKSKTYEYRLDVGETQSVFTRRYTCHIVDKLNVNLMKEAASYLVGTHDFKAFTSEKNEKKSTIRTIEDIKIYYYSEDNDFIKSSKELRISITGDGFLYNMVRIIVGTLIDVGKGLKKPEDMKTILESKNRQYAGMTVSSHALFLCSVTY